MIQGKPEISVEVYADHTVNLFAEGPTPDWALPLPRRVNRSAPRHVFTFSLEGLPLGAKPEGAVLRLTAVSATGAIETAFRLD
jgi:hypothetical protein